MNPTPLPVSSTYVLNANATQATKHFLETKILAPLCLLGNGAKPPIDSTAKPPINSADESPSDVPRQLVQQVLLPTLQRGLQLQIDAAKATTDLLKKVRGGGIDRRF